MSDPFPYSRDRRVAVCRACQSCIIPTATGQVRHLRAAPHRLSGLVLKATAALLSSYDLATEEELRRDRPAQGPPCAPIDGLETYTGYACTYDGCGYHTRRLAKMQEHMPVHGTTARQQQRRQRQGSGPLWRECLLQTYFTAKGRIDYFAVKEEGEEDGNKDANNEDEARIEDDPDLIRILVAAESMLRDAYDLCSETSPDRKMTQQRANILNKFYAGASGRSAGFRYFKNESTLVE